MFFVHVAVSRLNSFIVQEFAKNHSDGGDNMQGAHVNYQTNTFVFACYIRFVCGRRKDSERPVVCVLQHTGHLLGYVTVLGITCYYYQFYFS